MNEEIITIDSDSEELSEITFPETCKSNKTTKRDMNDIIELYATTSTIDPNVREKYYDNDTIIDSSETLRRWKIKKLADPNINHSKMNYRFRVFSETNAHKPRFFRPGLFMEENDDDDEFQKKLNIKELFKNLKSYELPDIICSNDNPRFDSKINKKFIKPLVDIEIEAKLKKDQADFETRLKAIEAQREEAEKSLQKYLNEQTTQLKDSYIRQIQELSETNKSFQSKSFLKNNLKSQYNESLGELEFRYKRELTLIKTAHSDEKNAIVSLYESGNYKKGKLDQYTTLEVYQPKSRRRRYVDDGQRKVLLLERDAQNVLIEDEIYNFFYGKP